MWNAESGSRPEGELRTCQIFVFSELEADREYNPQQSLSGGGFAVNRTVLCLLLLTCLLPLAATPQMPAPPGSRDLAQYEATHPTEPPRVASRRVDPVEMQRQADELAKLAQSVPGDMDQVAKGVLPKDIVGKLKQIEKLSKSLRSKLAN